MADLIGVDTHFGRLYASSNYDKMYPGIVISIANKDDTGVTNEINLVSIECGPNDKAKGGMALRLVVWDKSEDNSDHTDLITLMEDEPMPEKLYKANFSVTAYLKVSSPADVKSAIDSILRPLADISEDLPLDDALTTEVPEDIAYADDIYESESQIHRNMEDTANEKWAKYLLYLKEWADAKSDPLFMGCCPVCYDEWLDNEWNDIRPLDGLSISDRERIYREVERNYLIEDIKVQLDREEVDKSGLSHDQILSDDDIISHILHLYRKCETYDWENMEYAVENGIRYVLEARKEV